MHIHGNHISMQMMALASSQSAQRTAESRKAAAEVRRKLGLFADAAAFDRVQSLESEPQPNHESGPGKEPQPEEDFGRHFFSATA